MIYSPILESQYTTPILGPTTPSISVTAYAGTTADPIVTLALSATGATHMLVSDDHTFPAQFAWEPFAAAKDFHSAGTKYIYAKFRDAAGNDSAIAFARPQRIMYINKGATLASLPALIQARLAADAGGGSVSLAAVGSAQAIQAFTYYRRTGTSDYTSLPMALADGIRSAWIPASALAGGVEYYLQVEDGSGNVLATLPESNPAGNPFTLAATSTLAQSVRAASDNVFELAVGLSFDIPAGALSSNTDLRVSASSVSPTVPPGITLTGIGYQFTLADGTTSFARPISITFNYADSQVTGLDASRLRVYTVDGGALKLVGGAPNTTGHTVQVAVGHFSDFLLAEGSVIYPAAVTQAFIGEAVTVQASVVNYLPASAATLYYRRGSGDWQSLSMAQNGAYLEATIPAGDVTAEGLAYTITASDGAQTASFPASDPANHPQVVTVASRPAPAAVGNLSVSRAGNSLVLSWSAVTSDINGNSLTVDHYIVYRRAGSPYFTPASGDILAANVTGLTFMDDAPLLGADTSAFYAIQAVSNYNQASATPTRLGVFSFGLQAGSAGLSSQNGRPIPTWLPLLTR